MVRDGRVLLVDAFFVQVRPSPWRQAVDLGNMMLVLAVGSDPERVYQHALRYFTPEEIAEAFAATRGRRQPHPAADGDEAGRPRPAGPVPPAGPRTPADPDPTLERTASRAGGRTRRVPRRGGRRHGLPVHPEAGLGDPVPAHLRGADGQRSDGAGGPDGDRGSLHRGPPGRIDLRQRHRSQRRGEVLAGLGPGRRPGRLRDARRQLRHVERAAGGDGRVRDGTLRRRGLERDPAYRFYRFPGGCVTYDYSASARTDPELIAAADGALGFLARDDLVAYVQEQSGQPLCGAGTTCPGTP